jgi:hypothetical protein
MSIFNPTKEETIELQAIKTNEDFERNEASIILENNLKLKNEVADRERIERTEYSHRDDMLGGLFDAIGNGFEKMLKEALHNLRESRNELTHKEELMKIETEIEKILIESKSVGALEQRLGETKRLIETLDRHYQHVKGDTSAERLRLNNDLDITVKTLETCKGIKDKYQEINFSNHFEMKSELKRCFEKENVMEVKMKTSELLKTVTSSAETMQLKSAAATTKMRDVYTKSDEWVTHPIRDNDKYFYKEPVHQFTGQGIPKSSETGQTIAEQIKIRNVMEKGISDSNKIVENLSKLQPNQEHIIKVKSGQDLIEKIAERAREFAREFSENLKKQPEQDFEMGR